MNKWFLQFQYDKHGRGNLQLNEGNISVFCYQACTGAIDVDGDLVNGIKPGIWSIQEKSTPTSEDGMVVESKKPAYKIRLYTPKGIWSHYLIHADGGRRGTYGCIGVSMIYGNAPAIYRTIDNVLKMQTIIPVYINTPVPGEVYDGTVA